MAGSIGRRVATAACLQLLASFAGCTDADTSAVPGAMRGRVAIAGSEGPFLVVASSRGGGNLGHVVTNPDGRFEIDLPTDEDVVLHALLPTNPGRYAFGLVENGDAAGAQQPNQHPLAGTSGAAGETVLDEAATAEMWLLAVTGKLESGEALTAEEQAAASDIAQSMRDDGFDVCNEPSPGLAEHLRKAWAAYLPFQLGEHIDGTLAEHANESLLSRLGEVSHDISQRVVSINNPSSWSFYTNFLPGFVGLAVERVGLSAYEELSLHGFDTETISLATLEEIANYIWIGRAGNCREKGLLAAFAATRVPEFVQVAVLGTSSGYATDHAFGVGCLRDESVFDLAAFDVIDRTAASAGLEAAECYVIDPWADVAVRFQPSFAVDHNWDPAGGVAVLKVNLDGAASSGEAQDVSCCPNAAECTPFDVPDDAGDIDYRTAVCPAIGLIIEGKRFQVDEEDVDPLSGETRITGPELNIKKYAFNCVYHVNPDDVWDPLQNGVVWLRGNLYPPDEAQIIACEDLQTELPSSQLRLFSSTAAMWIDVDAFVGANVVNAQFEYEGQEQVWEEAATPYAMQALATNGHLAHPCP